MKKITFLNLLLISVLFFSSFRTDDDPFLNLLKKLEVYTKKFPQEKVHLHLDKPYYAIGDDIWFKAYIVDGRTSQITKTSNVLYVELIDQSNFLKKQLMLPIQNGTTWGDFKLADTLKEGNFRIRAYTQWMRNAGAEFFFDKTIKIGNSWSNNVFATTTFSSSKQENGETTAIILFEDANKVPLTNRDITYEIFYGNKSLSKQKILTDAKGEISISIPTSEAFTAQGQIIATITLENGEKSVKHIPIKIKSTAIDVQFFPEGGNMVQGIPSKIAIKAINTSGLGTDVSGIIIDNDGNQAASFKTTHLGMGSVFMNPLQGKSYSAKIKLEDGNEKMFPLPKAAIDGAVLTVNLDSTKVNVKVTISPNLLDKGDFNLVAHKSGKVLSVTKIPANKQLFTVKLDKEQFPSGTIQLSLFSPQNLTLAERLIFIDNKSDKIDINVQQLNPNYKIKEKVALMLGLTQNAIPTQGNLSISVTNTSTIAPDLENETNILTNLLLTSELKGYIEKPNYYFLNQTTKVREDLDNLLLTQGWNKTNWLAINDDKILDPIFKPENNIQISGTITKSGKPLFRSKVSLITNKGGLTMIDTLSDMNGRFVFDDLMFPDSTKFILQARSEKENKNVKISVDLLPDQMIGENKNIADMEVNVNQAIGGYLNASSPIFNELAKQGILSRTILLKEVKIEKQKGIKAASPYSANLNGPGNADQVIDVTQLEMANSIAQYLQGRIASVEIRNGMAFNRRNNIRIDTITNDVSLKQQAIQVVLDGMNMGADYSLNDLNPQNIASIEVLTSIPKLAIYGGTATNGLLIVTSKRGNAAAAAVKYAPGLTTFFPRGFNSVREFYSPKYEADIDYTPDLRTTVYWNPNLVSDNTGKLKFDYFNTDQPGTYRIVIEGMNANGDLARKVLNYQVN